jgi:hypothetical protein
MTATMAGKTILDVLNNYFIGAELKAMLVDSSYVFNKHLATTRAAVTGEVIASGYVSGGISLTTVTIEQNQTDSRIEIKADEADFGMLTATDIAGLLVYVDTGSAATDLIISAHTFPSRAPAGEDFVYFWDGVFERGPAVVTYFTY